MGLPVVPANKISLNFLLRICVLCIVTLFVWFLLYLTTPRLSRIAITDPNGSRSSYFESYNYEPGNTGIFRIAGEIDYRQYMQRIINLNVDDCLVSFAVNGKNIDISRLGGKSGLSCGTEKGVDVDLSRYLHYGFNKVEFTISNSGGPWGIYIRNSLKDSLNVILTLLLLLHFSAVVIVLLKKMNFSFPLIFILISNLFLRLWYMTYTVFTTRPHDVWHHIAYMLHILQFGRLPDADVCYECHQKPLYYIASAFIIRFARILHIQDYFSILQLFNILLFLLLAVVVAKLFEKVGKNSFITSTCVALFAFWPSGIIHGARITNEIAFYLGYGMAVYWMYRYLITTAKEESRHYLLFALISSLVSIFIKINAVGTLPLLLATHLLKHRSIKVHTKYLFIIVICGATFVLGAMVPYFFQNNHRPLLSRITKSDQISQSLYIGNSYTTYTHFDQNTFLRVPFISPWEDVSGRKYIWNYFFKSSLFGEFQFNTPVNKFLGILISYAAFCIVLYMFSGLILIHRKDLIRVCFFCLHLGILLLMFFVYRYNFPSSCNTDFRYIYPVLISFIFFYGFSLEKFTHHRATPILFIGYLLAWVFVILVTVFFVVYPFYLP